MSLKIHVLRPKGLFSTSGLGIQLCIISDEFKYTTYIFTLRKNIFGEIITMDTPRQQKKSDYIFQAKTLDIIFQTKQPRGNIYDRTTSTNISDGNMADQYLRRKYADEIFQTKISSTKYL